MWLMIDRALLPDCGDLVGGQWHFEVLCESSVPLKAEDSQKISLVIEVAAHVGIFTTVEVEHLPQVLIYGLLGVS